MRKSVVMARFRSLVLLVCVAVAGCSSVGGGRPVGQSQVVVAASSREVVAMKAEEVFFRHGFTPKGGKEGRLFFERDGGAVENVLYGNWQKNDTVTRVTLFITEQEAGTFALRVRSEVIRDTFGDFVDEPQFDIQGARYGVILRKIRDELAE